MSKYGQNDIDLDILLYVTIPNSVTSIGNNAFESCSSLIDLTIPSSVTSIGDYAFSSCSGLEKIVVEVFNPIFDSREECNAIINTMSDKLIVGCKNTHIPYSVTAIGENAFYGCSSLAEMTIPYSVISIGDMAFYECRGLTELTIGNNVISIGESAFLRCSGLTELTIPNSVTTIGMNVFNGCSGLTELTIGNSLTSISNFAFENCSSLAELVIPSSVRSIGNCAFSGCRGLTKLTIPNSVTSIGEDAFYNCSGLTEVTIGNSVNSISRCAFWGCSSLATLYSLNPIPPTAKSVNTSAFNDIHYTTTDAFVPEEALEAYQTADIWKNFQKLQAIGSTTAIVKVSAAGQIESANGQITVTGLTDGTTVTVYDLSGQQVGTAVSTNGQTIINTNLAPGSIAIVKIGDRSIKITVK